MENLPEKGDVEGWAAYKAQHGDHEAGSTPPAPPTREAFEKPAVPPAPAPPPADPGARSRVTAVEADPKHAVWDRGHPGHAAAYAEYVADLKALYGDARTVDEVAAAQHEGKSTAELLGIARPAREAYTPPPAPPGLQWDGEITARVGAIAHEWAMPVEDHARLYGEIARGYEAREISPEDRARRTSELIREYRGRWGLDFDRKVALINKVMGTFDAEVVERAGLDTNRWFLDLAGRLVDQATLHNSTERVRQENER